MISFHDEGGFDDQDQARAKAGRELPDDACPTCGTIMRRVPGKCVSDADVVDCEASGRSALMDFLG